MLEEILFYYRPCGPPLSEKSIDNVLSEYDAWIGDHCIPLDHELVGAAALLIEKAIGEGEELGCGHYQQPKIVASLRFSERAVRLNNRNILSAAMDSDKGMQQSIPGLRESALWCDIRAVLDREIADRSQAEETLQLQPSKVSVAARAARRRLHHPKPHLAVRIADEGVHFRTFARWLYHLLQGLADEQQQSMHLDAHFHSSSTEGNGCNVAIHFITHFINLTHSLFSSITETKQL